MERERYELHKLVYLIRHGQTEANVRHAYQAGADADSPLSEYGHRQAQFIARRTADLPLDAVLSSPLQRARDTAGAIAKHAGREVEVEPLLVEVRPPSQYEGLLVGSPETKEARHKIEEHRFDKGWHYSDEENHYELYERAKKVLEIFEKHPQKHLAAVSHGTLIKMLVAIVLMREPEPSILLFSHLRHAAFVNNTGISVIEYGSYADYTHWRLATLNDLAHLPTDRKPKAAETAE